MFWMVSLSDSPFLVLDEEAEKLTTSAPIRFWANSKEIRVRVEFFVKEIDDGFIAQGGNFGNGPVQNFTKRVGLLQNIGNVIGGVIGKSEKMTLIEGVFGGRQNSRGLGVCRGIIRLYYIDTVITIEFMQVHANFFGLVGRDLQSHVIGGKRGSSR